MNSKLTMIFSKTTLYIAWNMDDDKDIEDEQMEEYDEIRYRIAVLSNRWVIFRECIESMQTANGKPFNWMFPATVKYLADFFCNFMQLWHTLLADIEKSGEATATDISMLKKLDWEVDIFGECFKANGEHSKLSSSDGTALNRGLDRIDDILELHKLLMEERLTWKCPNCTAK